jgi:hypothetical protein
MVRLIGTMGRAEQADVHARRCEARVIGSDRQVARGHELATGRGRDAVDFGDHRLGDRVQARHQLRARLEQRVVGIGIGVGDDLAEVVSGRERRSPSFDQQHLRRGVGGDLVEGREHLPHERERERVASLGPVEYQPRDW